MEKNGGRSGWCKMRGKREMLEVKQQFFLGGEEMMWMEKELMWMEKE